MREIAIDTETTGLSAKEGDRIIELGCIEIIDKKITDKSFHAYINPQRELSIASTEISGLTNDFLQQFGTFDTIADDFLEFIADSRLVIHNSEFDIGFLNYEMVLTGKPEIENFVIDTIAIAKQKFPGSSLSLDSLCRKFSIDTTKRIKHGALIDAELLAEVYIQMSVSVTQKNIFSCSKKIEANQAAIFEYGEKTPIPSRDFAIPASETMEHLQFLQKLHNPIWNLVDENNQNVISSERD
ncbi:MAG: DNA polymerase III subunit epsilon [Holosporales bacterium]|nr:DNA polymerase III subunit epsilon [Holosporales bacterium]